MSDDISDVLGRAVPCAQDALDDLAEVIESVAKSDCSIVELQEIEMDTNILAGDIQALIMQRERNWGTAVLAVTNVLRGMLDGAREAASKH